MENKDKPTFPFTPNRPQDYESANGFSGLTKREYFAGLAMHTSDLDAYANKYGNKWAIEVAKDSVLMADELLKALE